MKKEITIYKYKPDLQDKPKYFKSRQSSNKTFKSKGSGYRSRSKSSKKSKKSKKSKNMKIKKHKKVLKLEPEFDLR